MTPSLPRPSDKWIPWYLVIGFVVMLLPLAPMGYYAVHTLPGVVTDKAYEEGLAYNKSIAAGAQAKGLGWNSELTVDADSVNPVVHYALRDKLNRPVDDAEVHLWMIRPVQGNMDRDLEMRPLGNGAYIATITLPARGVWDIRISSTKQALNFQTEKRIVLP